MLLKPRQNPATLSRGRRFSTLYRVDAIEACDAGQPAADRERFQYPLSGRCY